jgi:DNA polymerase III sliding clamp (beta) subunit (PCNA family)
MNNNESRIEIKGKVDVLLAMFAIITMFIDEVVIKTTPDKLMMSAVDPAHVAMSSLTVKNNTMITFKETKLDVTDSWGLDVDKISQLLKNKHVGSQDTCTIRIDDNDTYVQIGDTIQVRYKTINTDGLSEPKIPGLSLPHKFLIPLEKLEQVASQSMLFSDYINITSDKEAVVFDCKSDLTRYTNTFPTGFMKEFEAGEEQLRSSFPLDYFKNIIQGIKELCGQNSVWIHMNEEYPCRFFYETDNVTFEVYLAPRIDND